MIVTNPTTASATFSDFGNLTAVEVAFFYQASGFLASTQDYAKPTSPSWAATITAQRTALNNGLYIVRVRGVASGQRGPFVDAVELAEVQYVPLAPSNVHIS